MIGDTARPSEDEFSRVLHESFETWHSYLPVGSEEPPLPRRALNMKSPVSQTPSFLGGGLASLNEVISFNCEEKESTQGKDSLVVNGRSTWRNSKGICDLQPRVLPNQLLLAVGSRSDVTVAWLVPDFRDPAFRRWLT